MLYKEIKIEHENETCSLTTYILDNSIKMDPDRKRPMIVICPGGAYEFTSDREAEPIAIRMNAMGFHACILRYSVKPSIFPTALCELGKAIGIVREHADKWNIDTDKIIVLGFSAGGHLTASLGVFWNKKFLTEMLPYTSQQIRPNGMILCYPVITSGKYAHRGSFLALLGEHYEELLDFVSLEKQVSKDTPPTFLWHTYTDESVPVNNSLMFADALLSKNISLEMHIYPHGHHGLSLGTEETMLKNNEANLNPEIENWIDMAGRWIKGL